MNEFISLDFLRYLFVQKIIYNALYKRNGDKEIRTPDPLLARQVLSQLSYTPINPAPTYSPMPLPA